MAKRTTKNGERAKRVGREIAVLGLSTDDLRIMSEAVRAFGGARVKLTAEEWERAEVLLEGAS